MTWSISRDAAATCGEAAACSSLCSKAEAMPEAATLALAAESLTCRPKKWIRGSADGSGEDRARRPCGLRLGLACC